MDDLIIEKIDTVDIKVRCERSIAKELSDFFTFKVPGQRLIILVWAPIVIFFAFR